MATACGSHPKVQSEMKDKWPLHLPQIAFFGLSLVIWHGFRGCGGTSGELCASGSELCKMKKGGGVGCFQASEPPICS